MGIIFLSALGLTAIYLVVLYNSLVKLKNGLSKAWANIDVLLKQRHDELPKLVDTCRQYMQHEQVTLEKVIAARSQVSQAREAQDIGALGRAEMALRTGVGQLFAVAESYPELKANEQFLHLQSRISALEATIADRREFYNDSVNINNVAIEQFPGVLLARWFGFKASALLSFDAQELTDVDVGKQFRA